MADFENHSATSAETGGNSAKNAGLRPSSIRMDDSARDWLAKITKEIGAKNQNETLHELQNVWEENKARLMMPQKEAEIQIFSQCMQRIHQIYLGNLDDTMHMRDLVRTEYEDSLRSKDEQIRDLQRQLGESKEKFTDAMDMLNRKEKERVEKENQSRTFESEAKRLSVELEHAKSEIESMRQTIIINEKAVREHTSLVSEYESLLQKSKTADFVHQQEIAELKLLHQKELLEEKEKMHKEWSELIVKALRPEAQMPEG